MRIVLVLSLAVIGSFVGVLIIALQPEPVAPGRWAVAMGGGSGWPEAVPPPHTLRWCPPQARPQLLCQHLDYGEESSPLSHRLRTGCLPQRRRRATLKEPCKSPETVIPPEPPGIQDPQAVLTRWADPW